MKQIVLLNIQIIIIFKNIKEEKRRINISIVLFYLFEVNQVNDEWPLQENGESGSLCFYHSPLKRT